MGETNLAVAENAAKGVIGSIHQKEACAQRAKKLQCFSTFEQTFEMFLIPSQDDSVSHRSCETFSLMVCIGHFCSEMSWFAFETPGESTSMSRMVSVAQSVN